MTTEAVKEGGDRDGVWKYKTDALASLVRLGHQTSTETKRKVTERGKISTNANLKKTLITNRIIHFTIQIDLRAVRIHSFTKCHK